MKGKMTSETTSMDERARRTFNFVGAGRKEAKHVFLQRNSLNHCKLWNIASATKQTRGQIKDKERNIL